MKIKSLFLKALALIALALTTAITMFRSGGSGAASDTFPQRTWHTEVTTIKARVKFYGHACAEGIGSALQALKYELIEFIYPYAELFVHKFKIVLFIYDYFQATNPVFTAIPGYGNLAFSPTRYFDATDNTPPFELGIAEPAGPFTDPGDTKIIGDDHDWLVDQGAINLYLDKEGTDLSGGGVGEPGFQGKNYIAKGFVVGDDVATLELVENMAADAHIAFIKDPVCTNNRIMQLGCACDPAVMTYKFMSGNKKTGGKKGYEITFEAGCLFEYQGAMVFKA